MTAPERITTARLSGLPVAVAAWGKVAEWLTLGAMLTLIPRVLGPAGYGSFGLALSLVTVGSAAFALGGPTVMARFVAAAPPGERAGLARALALRAVRWRAAALALLAAVTVVLVILMPDRFPQTQTLIVLVAVVLDSAATLTFQIALGLDRPVLWSFRYPVQNVVLVASVPPLYALAGTNGALTAIVLSAAIAFVLGVTAIWGHLTGPMSAVPAEASRFAVLQACNGLLVQLLHRGGVVAVALFAGSRIETGYTALAMGVGLALTYAVWQVFVVVLPRLAGMAADDMHAAGALLTRLAGRVVTVLLPATVVAAAFAGPMLKLLAGGQFAPAQNALAWALATVPLSALTGAVSAAATIRLCPGTRLWTTAAGAAVFATAVAILVPRFGATGATAALLAGTMASVLAGTVLFADLIDWRLVAATIGASALVLAIGLVL